jgi:8-hydroxy-5-deazaflavin:NADPH oxidoreductase
MLVTIIGAGSMGLGIGTRMVAGGNDVEVIDNDPVEAEALAQELAGAGGGSVGAGRRDSIRGGVVVLAIGYSALPAAAAEYGEQLAGKVVVDITNPVDFATFDRLVTPPDSSAAEELAKLMPSGTPVVKAFNTTFAGTLVEGRVAGEALDVLIAGDDDAAKEKIAALVTAGGLRPIDVGPLRRARQLEHLGFLHMAVQDRVGSGYRSTVKLLW